MAALTTEQPAPRVAPTRAHRGPRDPGGDTLDRLRAQDPAAFADLVRTYHPTLLALARRMVGDAAGDVVQESWIRAYQALPRFEGRSSLKTWLLRITGNRARSHLTATRRLETAMGDLEADPVDDRFGPDGLWARPPAPWTDDTPEALLARDELKQVLDDALAGLPPMQRAALWLRDVEGVATAEACKILEVSKSNLHVLVHRARTRLWAAVDAYQGS